MSAIDQLYSTADAGKLLGGLHPNDVLNLIRDGRLEAVDRVVRGEGKRPRKFVKGSAIQRYIDSLPAAGPARTEPEPIRKRRPGRAQFARELAQATKYY